MEHIRVVKDSVRQIFWSLVLQGVLFLALAIMILIYPALLVAMVSVMFAFMGLMLLTIAFRLHGLWNKLPGFIKDAK